MTPREPRLSFASSDDDDNNNSNSTKDAIDIIGLDDGDSESVHDDASDSDNIQHYSHHVHHRQSSLDHHRGRPQGDYSVYQHETYRSEGQREDLPHSPSLGD